jgi:flavin reductase (DIM6/NTAB) family NADH-FMN oxidoreductase RutF
MHLDFTQVSPLDRYKIMIQSIIPRPVAWVVSKNENDSFNLAPFSYFNAIHSNPPLLMMSIGYKQDKTKKDTRANIERYRDYVINIASVEHKEQVTKSSLPFDVGVSEVTECGLELVNDWKNFSIPRIKSVKAAFALRLDQVIEVGSNKQGLIFGEIIEVYFDDCIITETSPLTIDALKLDPIARLGGNDYGSMTKIHTVPRPEYNPG